MYTLGRGYYYGTFFFSAEYILNLRRFLIFTQSLHSGPQLLLSIQITPRRTNRSSFTRRCVLRPYNGLIFELLARGCVNYSCGLVMLLLLHLQHRGSVNSMRAVRYSYGDLLYCDDRRSLNLILRTAHIDYYPRLVVFFFFTAGVIPLILIALIKILRGHFA